MLFLVLLLIRFSWVSCCFNFSQEVVAKHTVQGLFTSEDLEEGQTLPTFANGTELLVTLDDADGSFLVGGAKLLLVDQNPIVTSSEVSCRESHT